ncbi:hypothetical protein P152DRAFT_461429 [Eremomyces bilateralis CBS 781.70]|uniref:Uncharacterized protein n=1 Tax=Eremomyces bilateralis CBS 781.70 TaxID=1392243 RepID=A0A6G1FUB4_9PEZI|nr:uncharacterized protein P152DRAFT_461429 [Eremomyces bilateralis CBS 781.70]KAF1809485.1 hypothetical protein P152DRAFT_461429 [Eremomyces bilateralis CBS 781.70]
MANISPAVNGTTSNSNLPNSVLEPSVDEERPENATSMGNQSNQPEEEFVPLPLRPSRTLSFRSQIPWHVFPDGLTITVPLHGSCPACHHLHDQSAVALTLNRMGSTRTTVTCTNCGHKWFGIGGNSRTMSFVSEETILDPQDLRRLQRDRYCHDTPQSPPATAPRGMALDTHESRTSPVSQRLGLGGSGIRSRASSILGRISSHRSKDGTRNPSPVEASPQALHEKPLDDSSRGISAETPVALAPETGLRVYGSHEPSQQRAKRQHKHMKVIHRLKKMVKKLKWPRRSKGRSEPLPLEVDEPLPHSTSSSAANPPAEQPLTSPDARTPSQEVEHEAHLRPSSAGSANGCPGSSSHTIIQPDGQTEQEHVDRISGHGRQQTESDVGESSDGPQPAGRLPLDRAEDVQQPNGYIPYNADGQQGSHRTQEGHINHLGQTHNGQEESSRQEVGSEDERRDPAWEQHVKEVRRRITFQRRWRCLCTTNCNCRDQHKGSVAPPSNRKTNFAIPDNPLVDGASDYMSDAGTSAVGSVCWNSFDLNQLREMGAQFDLDITERTDSGVFRRDMVFMYRSPSLTTRGSTESTLVASNGGSLTGIIPLALRSPPTVVARMSPEAIPRIHLPTRIPRVHAPSSRLRDDLQQSRWSMPQLSSMGALVARRSSAPMLLEQVSTQGRSWA